jgi:hypothetical protein
VSRFLQAASSSIARDQIPRRVRRGSSGECGRKAAWIETETKTETAGDPQPEMLEALERAGAIREGDEEGKGKRGGKHQHDGTGTTTSKNSARIGLPETAERLRRTAS